MAKVPGSASSTAAPAAPKVRKVGGDNPSTEGNEEKRVRVKRPKFDITTARDASGNTIALNEDGQMTGIPVNWSPDYRPLKRNNFGTRETYVEYRLSLFDRAIQRLQDRKAEWTERLEETRGGGDPTKKAVRKAERLKRQLAELEAQLAAEGITL